MDWMDDALEERRRRGLYRSRLVIQSSPGPRVRLKGRDYVNFSSNDYLDLASDPRLARASARAAHRWGCGAGASPLVSGHSFPLRALERDLAQWEGTEAAVVFSTGYMANLAVVSSLAGRDDVVFSDAWNHASLIDGCRLARARVCIYPHADLDCLRDLLKTQPSATSRRLIVTDSVFSMDGDLAPLADLLDLAEKFDALVILDEAHATGVLGKQGRGVSGMLNPGIHSLERLVKVGTLSKALGAQGGFVCGSRALVDYLVNHARPYIFSTALAPPTAAAARKAIALCQSEPWRQEHVQMLASQLRRQLRELGRNIGATQCQIIPILVGQPEETVQLAQRLRAQGLLVPGIRPPSVPAGTARLRISLTAGHTEEDIRVLLGTLAG